MSMLIKLKERLFEYLSLIRIRHWIKNVFIFAPIIFSKKLLDIYVESHLFVAFAAFCFLSSSIYVFNDIMDMEKDRNHPVKMFRMLPSGRIAVANAWVLFAILSVGSLLVSFQINMKFGLVALGYFVLNFAYTLKLKDIMILDVFAISAGFLMRVVAGAYAIEIKPSEWLLICSFLLALFLALCKRRHELVLLEEDAQNHRMVLEHYTPYLLDQMIAIVTSASVVGYMLYTLSPSAVALSGGTQMIFTFPFVIYGIFRYLYLVHRHEKGGSPTQTLMMDPPLLLALFFWFVTTVFIIY